MNRKIALLCLSVMWLMPSCAKKEAATEVAMKVNVLDIEQDDKVAAADDADTPPPPPQIENSGKAADNINPEKALIKTKIIKSGNIRIKSEDIQESKKQLDILLKKHQAYYDNERLINTEQEIIQDLSLRIPQQNFELFVSDLGKGSDIIEQKNISAQDVTEEYTDVLGRLNHKREYLKRYTQLLAKATKVSEILEIESKISEAQEELESQEGRLKVLNNQIGYSTLHLNFNQKKPYVEKLEINGSFWPKFKNALSDGWNGLVALFLGLVSLWPFALLGFMLYRIIKWWRRRNSSKKSS